MAITKFTRVVTVLLLLTTPFTKLVAQTLPVGLLQSVEDSIRRSQLLGEGKEAGSYLIRPIQSTQFTKALYTSANGKASLLLLPFVLQQQVDAHHPFGSNDNSMISARGYQSQISGGLYAKLGPLRIQLRPEYLYAENKSFLLKERGVREVSFTYNPLVEKFIDNPSRIGDYDYVKGNWGQSSIRLNFDPVSFGLSNENLWWGPGIKNSLLMSNNAGGFKHLTFNTTRPVDIAIGSIEAQVIGGRLEGAYVSSKPNIRRNIFGGIVTYQPKWVPGLYLGFDASSVAYYNNTDTSSNYHSLFGRLVMPETKAEVYFQYGRNKQSHNTLGKNLASNAYVAGFNKLISLPRTDQYMQVGVELTQLESPRIGNAEAASWYTDKNVVHGYTNRGQLLAAAVGPGGNMQSLDINWVKGFKKIGISMDRIVNNNDYFYAANIPITDVRRHWIDLAFSGKFSWNFNKLLLNSEFTYIRSLNYQWELENGYKGYFWDIPHQDLNNVHAKLGLMYYF